MSSDKRGLKWLRNATERSLRRLNDMREVIKELFVPMCSIKTGTISENLKMTEIKGFSCSKL